MAKRVPADGALLSQFSGKVLLQMKSKKIIHIPTTSSKLKNTHARVHCSKKQGILDRESLNAMDFRLDTVQDFLIKLGKPCMHLLKISIFSL